MAYGNEMLKRLQALNSKREVAIATSKNRDEILNAVKSQLYAGERGDNMPLKPYRDREYAEIKNAMNPLPTFGTPDYYLTGSYYQNFYLDVDENQVQLGSTDSKAQKLERREGRGAVEMYKMNQQNKQRIWNEKVQPMAVQECKNKTGIK